MDEIQKKQSFVMYASYLDAAVGLTDEEFREYILALQDYALDGFSNLPRKNHSFRTNFNDMMLSRFRRRADFTTPSLQLSPTIMCPVIRRRQRAERNLSTWVAEASR